MFTYVNAFMRGYLSQDVHIKSAEKKDLSSLAEIHAASFSQSWSDGEFAKMSSNENYDCLVAQLSKDKPVGFVFVRSV